MGNPAFAVPSLQSLSASNHTVAAVVTNPPKRMGRGKKERISAVHHAANDLNIPVIFADSLKSQILSENISKYDPDIFCVVAYRILPSELLQIPKIGSINLHGSILPKYRGAAPIQRSIMNGDTSTGLTTFLLDNKVDTGKILLQKTIQIESNDTYGSLSEKMSIDGAEFLVETLNKFDQGSIQPEIQDHSNASFAPKIKSDERAIIWSDSAIDIHNHIRGITPIPGAFTTFKNQRIKIFETKVIDENNKTVEPGTVTQVSKTSLIIQTSDGQISIKSLQREGKRRMQIQEFLVGTVIEAGEVFAKND